MMHKSIMFHKRYIILVITFTVSFLMLPPSALSKVDYTQMGEDYLKARAALQKGNQHVFGRLKEKLKNYPLYGYLEFDNLRRQMRQVSSQRIQAFLSANSDSPISHRMRRMWLQSLARKNDWDGFLDEYVETKNTKLRCYYTQALFETGRSQAAMKEADKLWLVGKSQPKICAPAFQYWQQKGGMTKDKVWERIRLGMKRGQLSLVKFLAKNLNKYERKWVDRWRDMHRHPADNLKKAIFKRNKPIARQIYRHGVQRLARRNAGAAAIAWNKVRQTHLQKSGARVVAEVDRYIALRAAFQQHPNALEWLTKLEAVTPKVREWRIRAALGQQDWWAVLTGIDALPDNEKDSEQWQYWRARMLELQSQELPMLRTAAKRAYSALAKERSYHGFLAADRLAQEYQWNNKPLNFSVNDLWEIEKKPGVLRAKELYRLGFITDARREWLYAIKGMSRAQLQQASVIAHQWGWHDRAISTVAKGAHFDDLPLRFPVAFQDQVLYNANQNSIEPAWIFGILRQESAFMADARSSAGALGLMQLMPKTGKFIAQRLKTRLRSTSDLLDVKRNIRLGSAYLRRMLDRNNGHRALATASYNAGPNRVKQWMPTQSVDADLWVEMIPFNETRKYVQRVMAYTIIYNYRLGGRPMRLTNRLPVIEPINASSDGFSG